MYLIVYAKYSGNKYKINENIKGKSYNSIMHNTETYQHLMECFHQQSGSSIYQQTYSTTTSNVIYLLLSQIKLLSNDKHK